MSNTPIRFFEQRGYTVYQKDYDSKMSGANGSVFLALRNSDGKRVAIKSVKKYVMNPKTKERSYFDKYFIEKEADILHALTNPGDEKQSSNCKLLGSLCLLNMFETDKSYYFVTPWIDGPSLTSWIHNVYNVLPKNIKNNNNHSWIDMYRKGEITEYNLNKSVLYLMLELCKTVKGLHDQNIAHSDLKPDNIHVSDKSCLMQVKNGFNASTFSCHLVILDFGISCFFTAQNDEDKCFATTPMMNAPESWGMNSKDYHNNVKAQDIFSLGLIIAWMAMGHHPYDGNTDDLKSGSENTDTYIFTGITELDIILVDNALEKDPQKRNLDYMIESMSSLYERYSQDHAKKYETLELLRPAMNALDESVVK